MPKARCFSYTLNFTFRAGTSRGVMTTRETHFIVLEHEGQIGVGECAPLPGLSTDNQDDFVPQLQALTKTLAEHPIPSHRNDVRQAAEELVPRDYPALRFGTEMAWLDVIQGGKRHLIPSVMQPTFTPLPINGLIWMGEPDVMLQQIDEKIAAGFRCIKMKIGAIDFDQELRLLAHVRRHYPHDVITLRVDANGAFTPKDALAKLNQLARYDIHSIEQPVRQGQPALMASLCQQSPIPIALDEELIRVVNTTEKEELLDTIGPQYIILKPSLLGGMAASDEWIALAEARGIGWWATSALESNIGLNAIAQWVAQYAPTMPQGLGTGQLYHNNIESPVVINQGYLTYDQATDWDMTLFRSDR